MRAFHIVVFWFAVYLSADILKITVLSLVEGEQFSLASIALAAFLFFGNCGLAVFQLQELRKLKVKREASNSDSNS